MPTLGLTRPLTRSSRSGWQQTTSSQMRCCRSCLPTQACSIRLPTTAATLAATACPGQRPLGRTTRCLTTAAAQGAATACSSPCATGTCRRALGYWQCTGRVAGVSAVLFAAGKYALLDGSPVACCSDAEHSHRRCLQGALQQHGVGQQQLLTAFKAGLAYRTLWQSCLTTCQTGCL
jgi:hypothetical protein